MESDQIFFESVMEDCGWYFVKYHPPVRGNQFATLSVIVLEADKPRETIAAAMESELDVWLRRYPVTTMVSAFDDTGSLIALVGTRQCDHLIGYVEPKAKEVVSEWRLLTNDELPKEVLDSPYLRTVYADIPFKTKQQLREQAAAKVKQVRMGWWIVFVWAVVVPAGVAILQWWSDWLGIVVLSYSLYKAVEKALRLMGKWKKSTIALQEEQDVRMRHHHYHCERNPEGFERLKQENFDRWAREGVRKKAEALKN